MPHTNHFMRNPMLDFMTTLMTMQQRMFADALRPMTLASNGAHPVGNGVHRVENGSRRFEGRDEHTEEFRGEERVIAVPKEELHVRKRQLRREGSYRIVSTVTEHPVEREVGLRSETVVIERRPAEPVPLSDGKFETGTLEVHELYEIPVIEKFVTQAEQIVIRKRIDTETVTVREKVREFKVDVVKDRAGLPAIYAEAGVPAVRDDESARFDESGVRFE